ncbi:hypothetical protein ACGFWD_21605 [Streptomyces sp. NPDC048448]|uniref:hypothetical protein n=1 Tax=unclassified Streptomyces TaxID=2593676 RepID=UPI0033A54C1D
MAAPQHTAPRPGSGARPHGTPVQRLGLGTPVVQRLTAAPEASGGVLSLPLSGTPHGAPARATGTPGPTPITSTTTVAAEAVQRSTARISPPHAPVGGGLPVAAPGPAGRSDSPVVQRLTAPGTPAPSPAVGHPTPVVRYASADPSTRLAATARHHHDGTSPLRPATSPNGPLGGTSSPAAGGSAGPAAPARPANSGHRTGAAPRTAVPLTAVPPVPPLALPVQRASVAPPAPPAPKPGTPPVTPHVQRVVNPTSPPPPPPPTAPPPAYSASEPPSSSSGNRGVENEQAPPAYTPVDFNPRALTPGQIDELTHKLAGPITRLLRTELRLERERIGKLRDPRR